MKQITKIFTLLMLAVVFGACSNNKSAIENLVDEINSPMFRAEQAKTGLFDDTKAEILDSQLCITFLCRPFVNLSTVAQEDIPELEATTTQEFRNNLVDETFRKGIEALKAEKMTILLTWQDVNGFKIYITINPEEILA